MHKLNGTYDMLNEKLRAYFEAMNYEYLIAYAELVFDIEDPEGMKYEDLINEMVERFC